MELIPQTQLKKNIKERVYISSLIKMIGVRYKSGADTYFFDKTDAILRYYSEGAAGRVFDNNVRYLIGLILIFKKEYHATKNTDWLTPFILSSLTECNSDMDQAWIIIPDQLNNLIKKIQT